MRGLLATPFWLIACAMLWVCALITGDAFEVHVYTEVDEDED